MAATMDTLKAAQELESAGLDKDHAAAIARVISEQGRENLYTTDHLDARLWQHSAMIVGSVLAIATLFKLFN